MFVTTVVPVLVTVTMTETVVVCVVVATVFVTVVGAMVVVTFFGRPITVMVLTGIGYREEQKACASGNPDRAEAMIPPPFWHTAASVKVVPRINAKL